MRVVFLLPGAYSLCGLCIGQQTAHLRDYCGDLLVAFDQFILQCQSAVTGGDLGGGFGEELRELCASQVGGLIQPCLQPCYIVCQQLVEVLHSPLLLAGSLISLEQVAEVGVGKYAGLAAGVFVFQFQCRFFLQLLL
ncbi:hypothetical protein D3C84_589510 [compost metagenome]